MQAAFLANPVAARAIRMITENAGSAPVVSTPAAHPAVELLRSCGFGASGPGLLETLAGHMLLHGNAFVDVAVGHDGLPAALFALRPERVSIEVDGDGWPDLVTGNAGSGEAWETSCTPGIARRATAVSPSIVSGRVVATMISPDPSSSG